MKKLFVLLFISLLIFTTVSASSTISTNITTGGNVGIGSTTPYSRLSIDNTSVATGEELITNGTFTGGTTGWTLRDNVVYGSNNVVSTYAGGDPSVSTTFSVVSGRTYIINYTISNAPTSTNAFFYLTNNNPTYEDPASNNGTYTILYKATHTGTETITFDDWNYITGDTWTLDDVSIKETSEVVPPLKVIGNNGKNIFNLGEDLLGSLSIGNSSFSSNTTGYYNTSIGHSSMGKNTTGSFNTSLGYSNLISNTIGSDNTAIGYGSLVSNTIGTGNTAIGAYSLFNNTSGIRNSANGNESLYANTTGNYNTANGYQALAANTTGSYNTANGFASLYYNTSATSTTAMGELAARGTAIYSNQGGVYVGYRSGYSAGNSSDYNTLIGYQAGYGITTGKNNIVLGTATSTTSVNNITTGSQNILIGNNIGLPSATASGQLNIGNIIFGTGITSTGSTVSGGSIGIGIASPTSQFQVATSSSNATTTMTLGKTGQNKGSCLELFTSNGTAIYAYVKAGDTTFTLSSVSCK